MSMFMNSSSSIFDDVCLHLCACICVCVCSCVSVFLICMWTACVEYQRKPKRATRSSGTGTSGGCFLLDMVSGICLPSSGGTASFNYRLPLQHIYFFNAMKILSMDSSWVLVDMGNYVNMDVRKSLLKYSPVSQPQDCLLITQEKTTLAH